MKKAYDYLIVGAGLFGATFAHCAAHAGKRCLVLERRPHIAGNIFDEEKDGILIHRYGAHIFHTSNGTVWRFVQRFCTFNHFVNSPIANYRGEIYNLPFNMNTFSRLWGISAPAEAERILKQQRAEITGEPRNLEEQAIRLVGRDVYERLIRGYTEKQWGRPCTELPAFIIKRLPVRLTYDNNYFSDPFQGIPKEGYTALVRRMLEGVEVRTDTDYLADKPSWDAQAQTVLYTGTLDAFYGYRLGQLSYRSLRFETERMDIPNYQGVAVVNYTDRTPAYTRVIEHKHFMFGQQPITYVTREYPAEWQPGLEPYYPVNDAENQALYARYRALADQEPQTLFGGRLAEYRYYDMDATVASALRLAEVQGLIKESEE